MRSLARIGGAVHTRLRVCGTMEPGVLLPLSSAQLDFGQVDLHIAV